MGPYPKWRNETGFTTAAVTKEVSGVGHYAKFITRMTSSLLKTTLSGRECDTQHTGEGPEARGGWPLPRSCRTSSSV